MRATQGPRWGRERLYSGCDLTAAKSSQTCNLSFNAEALEDKMTRGSETPASEPEKPSGQHQPATLHRGSTVGVIDPHPYRGNTADNVPAEGEGVLQDWLGTAYVRTSPEETVELCLTIVSVPDMV